MVFFCSIAIRLVPNGDSMRFAMASWTTFVSSAAECVNLV